MPNQMTWLSCATFLCIIGLSVQHKANLKLDIEPRYVHVEERTPVNLICTMRDGDGGAVPLDGCEFMHFGSNVTWDFGTASTTMSKKVLAYDTQATYHGNGLLKGECGMTLAGLGNGYSYILGCRVKPAAGGTWRYAVMMTRVDGDPPVPHHLQPSGVVVSLPGSDVPLVGHYEGQVNGCDFYLSYNIGIDLKLYTSENSSTSEDNSIAENNTQYRAWRDDRRCGVTLLNVHPDQGEFMMIGAMIDSSKRSSIDILEFVVATPPASPPRLSVNTTDATFQAGDMLHASCVVEKSLPVSNITWLFDGVVVRDDNWNEAPAESEWLWNHKPQMIVQRLARRLTPEDDGKELKCRAGHLALPYGAIDSNTHIVRVGGS